MLLRDAEAGAEHIIKQIKTEDEELDDFLFSLGCYAGESIFLVSKNHGGCVISVKNSRYNIDLSLAAAIIV